jgi:predicted nucleotidyltransferase
MLIESNTQKFLALIFKYPTSGFTIREIAKRLNISPPTASSISKKLEKIGLIRLEKEKVQYKVFGNIENETFKDIKRIFNIFSLLPLKDFLIKEFNPDLIVVYGSYSMGEDIEDSDIDIFVESVRKKQVNLSRFEKKLGRSIHLIVDKFGNLPKELRINIVNGVILYGVIEV